jgi:hypothetical protein
MRQLVCIGSAMKKAWLTTQCVTVAADALMFSNQLVILT